MNVHAQQGEIIEGITGPAPSRAVATQPQRRAPARRAPADEGAALLAMIERAATDPAVNIDKMERLFAMHERAVADRRKAAFALAFSELQPDLPTVAKNGRIEIKNKEGTKVIQSTPFALWEDIHKAITPTLGACGFTLSFRINHPEGKVAVTAVLLHREGHQEETTIVLQQDGSGSKNNVQGVGSSVSYGKRYSATALLNINVGGEDDDGAAAGAGADDPYITEEQHEELRKLILDSKANLSLFLDYVQAPSLSDVLKTHYTKGRQMLLQKIERNKKGTKQ